jgi:hypothetical protein
MPKLPSKLPSLKDFLQRDTVLKQFRAFVRATGGLDEPERSETRKHVRAEFKRHAGVRDPSQIRTLVVMGQRQLDKLRELVSTVGDAQYAPITAATMGSGESESFFADAPSHTSFGVGARSPADLPSQAASRQSAVAESVGDVQSGTVWPWAGPVERVNATDARIPKTTIWQGDHVADSARR